MLILNSNLNSKLKETNSAKAAFKSQPGQWHLRIVHHHRLIFVLLITIVIIIQHYAPMTRARVLETQASQRLHQGSQEPQLMKAQHLKIFSQTITEALVSQYKGIGELQTWPWSVNMNAVSASKHKEDFLFSALNKGQAEDINKEQADKNSHTRENHFIFCILR